MSLDTPWSPVMRHHLSAVMSQSAQERGPWEGRDTGVGMRHVDAHGRRKDWARDVSDDAIALTHITHTRC